MKRFYVTTAIDYVNNLPHLGTAYEKIGADAIARFLKMEGLDVHFQMGNDEHSANVRKEAERRGIAPKAYCDAMRKKFEEIWASLGISYDGFIQTSEPRHHAAVRQFISLLKPEDVTRASYEGYYCESCEAFLTEKDLDQGKCPTHKSEPKWLHEENFFFALSRYQERLLDHYRRHPEFILPEIRRNEIISHVRGGLKDISISRASVDWGIPFPGDATHVVYVWFDALINYLTAVGFGAGPLKGAARSRPSDWKKRWPADLHIIGKDITRFHCVIWPAMLMSARLPLPKTVFGHGFVFLKGEKMSKTLGNIVTPLDIVPKYGADALRYYLLRESSFGADGDFTWENFIKRYNSDLANDLGNLLNRTLGMAHKYLKGQIKPPKPVKGKGGGRLDPEAAVMKERVLGAVKRLRESIDWKKSGDIEFHKGLAAVWEAVGSADKYIDASAPWKLAKENKTAEINGILYRVVDSLRNIAILIAPFLPQTSQEIWKQLGLAGKLKWDRQKLSNVRWGATPAVKTAVGKPIFPRIESIPAGGDAFPEPVSFRSPAAQQPSGGRQGENADSGRAASERGRLSVAGSGKASPPAGKESLMEIDITEFQKLDLRVAEVKQAEKVEGADRLLKLQIDLGGETRQIVAGIALHYKPEELVGRKIVVVTNLRPATIRGIESKGMLLAASNADGLSILTLDRPLSAGSKVK